MTVFDLLFLFLVLVTTVALVMLAVLAVRRQWVRAGPIVRRVAIGAAVYFAIVIGVSVVRPRGEHRVGELRCFDDWCITVVEAKRAATPPGTRYDVRRRLSNRARRVPMGEKGTVVYLTDAQGRRFDPLPDPATVAFATLLQPGESREVVRHFEVAQDARELGLVYTHEGGFPIGWLIVGEGGWFQRPSIVRLD